MNHCTREDRPVSSFNLFQTPPAIAWQMVEKLPELTNSSKVLEPSAGLGRLLKQADFLQCTAEGLGGKFDAVIMNPPFQRGTDIKHIDHAFGMLERGGILVALCYNGVKQNEILKPLCDSWEVLPEGTFKSEGTGASVALLTIKKGK